MSSFVRAIISDDSMSFLFGMLFVSLGFLGGFIVVSSFFNFKYWRIVQNIFIIVTMVFAIGNLHLTYEVMQKVSHAELAILNHKPICKKDK